MTKSMILPSILNLIVSASKHMTLSTSKNKHNANETSVLRIQCVDCTECNIERLYTECGYVPYNKIKKYTYKHCKCFCGNSRGRNIATLPVNILEFHTTKNKHFVKEKRLDTTRPYTVAKSSILWLKPRYDQLCAEADKNYRVVERLNHIHNKLTEFSAFLQDCKSLELSTTLYSSTIITNCRHEITECPGRIHGYEKSLQCKSRLNENNYTCANDVSSKDFFRIRNSVLGIATSNKKDYNELNSKSSASNRMRSRRSLLLGNGNPTTMCSNAILYILLILLLSLPQVRWVHSLLTVEPKFDSLADDDFPSSSAINNNPLINVGMVNGSDNRIAMKVGGSSPSGSGGYMDKLKMNNLERSVAAVLKKVAYGTTSTTKRSIPDNTYTPSLTTIATPLLTTLRYAEKSTHQQQINLHHRNYELDLERDHALPTSAPNADILKSNSNPTYPNPNRNHNHERERHRHVMKATPPPSIPNILKKNIGQSPTIPMYPGDIPSYSPPARSFFTPPLPPEYQNPFADKPTLRGTNNEGIISNTGTYINRRPIPPPSLMPGHERIPFRPPDLAASTGSNSANEIIVTSSGDTNSAPHIYNGTIADVERKKALNTPSRSIGGYGMINVGSSNTGEVVHSLSNANDNIQILYANTESRESPPQNSNPPQQLSTTGQEVLPSIRRILSGSNGNKGEIPEVLLKHATSRPIANYNQPPSPPVVLLDDSSVVQKIEGGEDNGILGSSNINKNKNGSALSSGTELYEAARIETMENRFPDVSHHSNRVNSNQGSTDSSSTTSTAAAIGKDLGAAVAAAATTSTMSSTSVAKNPTSSATATSRNTESGVGSSIAAAASSVSTWAVAWNIHVYFSVVLFTILVVCSLYKILTYNKLTHLFSQSYFMCIHLVLIVICSSRIFYLCFDAYNIHSTFNLFVSELLLYLPATFLTISFSVLILFLFLKALNHKNNRYSALIRPLTVMVGCGVHVVLCITLHYVESYTVQNQQQQQQLLYQQQQQHFLQRRQQQQQILQQHQHQHLQQQFEATSTTNFLSSVTSFHAHTALLLQSATIGSSPNLISSTTPPRVLSLICQIIYIFVCLFLGLLYLYLYRILKRILRSKSQNYIHGYQNLSYAIHITIATALLFVLLAALQIFGAISISTTRPLLQQLTADIDWLQWGYQFSLRLIEIAIISLLSWVVGLKTSGGSSGAGAAVNLANNADARYGVAGGNSGSNVAFASGPANQNREKHPHHNFHNNHSNVAGFFLPCTSSSSQEQFETDYPAVCNANTNLHTYTMRTGKLIYDDSYALNSLSSGAQPQLTGIGNNAIQSGSGVIRNAGEFHLQTQPTYQRPYDSGSINSAMVNHNVSEYGTQSTLAGGGVGHYGNEAPQYADYLTDATIDHYENPNFDLGGSVSGSGFGVDSSNPSGVQKLTKTSTTSTTASSSGDSGASAASQQQMLLLQSDSCYSEPLQAPNATFYDFKNFERPQLVSGVAAPSSDCWLSESHTCQPLSRDADNHKSKREKKIHSTLDRSAYGNPDRRSSNSTHSCTSSNGRYSGYNSFDRGLYNGVRKSGTLNNIVGSIHTPGTGIIHGRNSSSSSPASSKTLSLAPERHHYQKQQRSGCANANGIRKQDREHEYLFSRSSLDHSISQPSHQQPNSDDDMMLSGSNVERTNLIDNEDNGCIINSKNTTSFCGGRSQANDVSVIKIDSTKQMFAKTHLKNNTHSNMLICQSNSSPYTSVVNTSKQQRQDVAVTKANIILGSSDSHASNSTASNTSATSSTSGSSNNRGAMVVAEHGFVRFRAIDDINNAQGIGIHNASILN